MRSSSFAYCCLAQHQPAARPAQRLVRRRRNEIGVRHRARVHAPGHQSRDVRHVHEEQRAHRARDFRHAREIDDARIGARARDDHFRLVLVRQAVEFVVIDRLGFLAHAVGNELVHLAGKIERMPVRQVPAVRQVHAQHGVARLQRRHVDGHVRLRARMRLHVGVLGAEQRFRAVDGQLLGAVHEFAAAVIALARIALGVLVGEHRAHGFEHGFGNEIFRGDQFEAGALAASFFAEHLRDLRIDFRERPVHAM